jgi:hypothetical protein
MCGSNSPLLRLHIMNSGMEQLLGRDNMRDQNIARTKGSMKRDNLKRNEIKIYQTKETDEDAIDVKMLEQWRRCRKINRSASV